MEPERFTRQQVCRLYGVDEDFLILLEEESIITASDDPLGAIYSAEVCERVRVAHELMHELEVNAAGAAIILHLREQLDAMRRQLYTTLNLIREAAIGAERRRGGR